jgi:hypothetical protein
MQKDLIHDKRAQIPHYGEIDIPGMVETMLSLSVSIATARTTLVTRLLEKREQ